MADERKNALIEQTTELLETVMRRYYEGGDGMALMHTIHVCATLGEALPDWAADAFQEAYWRVTQFRVRSWDDVFGAPHKGTHLHTASAGLAIYKRVNELRGVPINGKRRTIEDVCAEVGPQFNISGGRARDVYYKMRKRFKT